MTKQVLVFDSDILLLVVMTIDRGQMPNVGACDISQPG